jgi:hypothetical protein
MVDPDGRIVIAAATIALALKGAAIGAAIGGATYTAKVATSNGGFQNWNWGQFGAQVGLGALNGALSTINPLSVNLGSGFSLGISPQIAVGSDGLGIGFNATLGYSSGGFTAGLNAGASFYTNQLGTNKSGFEGRLGFGISYDGKSKSKFLNNFSYASIGMNYFASGETSQPTAFISIGKDKGHNYTFENDVFIDGGDRFRTAGNTFKFGNNEIGLLMYTGDPGLKQRNEINGFYEKEGLNDPDKYRFGGLYYGRSFYGPKDKRQLNPLYGRIGFQAEAIRNFVQNKVIHDSIGVPHFKQLNNQWSIYSGVYSKNPFTNY